MFHNHHKRMYRYIITVFFLLSLLSQPFVPVSLAADPLPPTPAPPKEPTNPESFPTVPTPTPGTTGEIEIERAKAAIEDAANKLIQLYGPRYSLVDLRIDMEGDWAVGTLPSGQFQSAMLPNLYIIAYKDQGGWRILDLSSASEDRLILNSIPATLLSSEQAEVAYQFPLPANGISGEPAISDGCELSSTENNIPEPRYLYLDNRDSGQLMLLLPEKSLIFERNGQTIWLHNSIISARFLPDGRIIAIQDDMSLIILEGNTSTVELLPEKSANGPIFVSPDGQRLAYGKPLDFEGGSIPFTNGVAVFDLKTKHETVLVSIPYVSVHLYGWSGDSLVVDVPYWDPETLQPSPFMYLGALPSSAPSTSIITLAQLPAIRPESNYPETSPDQKWLVYDSWNGQVVVDLNQQRYVVIPPELSQPTRAELMNQPLEVLPSESWHEFDKTDQAVPLPQVVHSETITSSHPPVQPSAINAILFYRPASDSIPVSAYKDLNGTAGQIRDWTGWTGTSWVYGHAYDQHEGTDYDGPNQSPWGAVYPAQTGTVGTVFIDCANTYPNPSYGTNFRIYHGTLSDGNNYSTGYAHLRCETVAVVQGQTITSLTQQIAEIGNTGNSTGAHLHLNVRKNDVLVDPYELGIIGGAASGGGTACPSPYLNSPSDGFVSSNPTINFSWSALSGCTYNGYTFRIKTVNTMNYGGDTYIDTGNSETNRTQTIDEYKVSLEGNNINWYNRDLYWGVRPANCSPSCDSSWSVRRFRIQPAAQCSPNSDQIGLYVDGNYSGQRVLKGIGDYTNPSAIGLPNDSITSIKVGSNVKATLCRDDNYAGGCEDFLSDDSDLGNNSIGNDSVSSVNVQSRTASCFPSADQIALYGDVNYGGSCVVLGLGNYSNPSMLGGLGNDNAESVRVGSNVKAVLCRDDNYAGGCDTFTSDDSNLGDNAIGGNTVSSVQVQSKLQVPSAPVILTPINGTEFIEGSSINLSWTATGNEYYGEIWGGPAGTMTFGWQSATQSNIGAQWAGYTYSWHVKARNSVGESSWSSTYAFSILPATPSGFSGQADSCNQVSLYWSDNSGNEEGYYIFRNDSLLAALGANSTSYTDSDLAGNTTYVYSVHAYRGSLVSYSSGDISVTTPTCAPTLPDLVPSLWGGWPYPIVPSSFPETFSLSDLYAGQITYIDWGITNTGAATTGGQTYGALYIDDVLIYNALWGYDGDVGSSMTWAYLDWEEVIEQPGWHTLKFVADPDNLIAELNEYNNVFEHAFYWDAVAPYFDDMEAGGSAWEATGLWHRVDSSSAYPYSSSGEASWWYGQESTGNFDTGSANSGSLTSPSVYLPTSGYYFQFRYAYETESRATVYDQRWVQLQVDDGPFFNLFQLSEDLMMYWHYSPVVDLSAYAGHRVRLRFYFDSIDDNFNDFQGWYIDDIQVTATAPPVCGDIHEPNNMPVEATAISYNQLINADICTNGDFDYYAFNGTAGDQLVIDIDASLNGSILDAYITLFDANSLTVLSQNDDDGYSMDSKLGYSLPSTGMYYLRVRAWNHPSVGSPYHFYSLKLYTDTSAPISAEFTWPLDSGWLNPVTGYAQAAAEDDLSGIKRLEFFWHSNDWQNTDWVWLGVDTTPWNGWQFYFDTTDSITYTREQGGALYLLAYDFAENWMGTGVWNIGVDDTAPTASVDIQLLYGGAPFRAFYVVWSGEDAESGVASYDVQVKEGGGEWTDLLTFTPETGTRYVGTEGVAYYFRVRPWDAVGNMGSYTDGSTMRTVNTCAVGADDYEDDDTSRTARKIFPNLGAQYHNFNVEGDIDWLVFNTFKGMAYTITTDNVGGYADTVVELYTGDGTTLLAANDDDPDNWPASRLEWLAPSSGVYRIKVYHWEPTGAGCTTTYRIAVTAPFKQIYLPLANR